MPIASLEEVKTLLGVTDALDDEMLTLMQASADSYVEKFCGQSFSGGSFTEDHAGGAKVIFLRNYPVVAVSELKVDASREFGPESVVDPDRYLLYPDRGVVECLDGPFVPSLPGWQVGRESFPGAVRVTYSTAVDAVPSSVVQAYADLIGHWYRQTKTHVASGQLNLIDSGTGSSYPWGQSMGYRIPVGVTDLLKPFRVPSM